MIKIAFIILTWNSEKYINNCIKSILDLNFSKIYISIVDNGSTDSTLEILENLRSDKKNVYLNLIKLKNNLGTTISRNLAIKEVKDKVDYICILDSDTIINQNAIEHMIILLNKSKKNGIVGPMMKSLDGTIQPSGRNIPTLTVKVLKVLPFSFIKKIGEDLEKIDIKYDNNILKVGYLMSACWLIKVEVIEKIGLLDEKIFYAPEDVEFCLRAWINGYNVLYDKNIEIIHEWQRISRKKLISKHNWEHIKGLIYLFFKYKYMFSTKKFEKIILENR
ncbi:glycosyltransferase family 2 protein [Megamonas sp.]|jgi:GT2 family glycosyltransferase|uniref:glycosyltransferase family 2 protein n=1 Tax=Megamonas sp. TaxID=2049033 RepID=UPI002582F9C3|nr:glycosyltransferase family 2 protein [Megamonas sp.]